MMTEIGMELWFTLLLVTCIFGMFIFKQHGWTHSLFNECNSLSLGWSVSCFENFENVCKINDQVVENTLSHNIIFGRQ